MTGPANMVSILAVTVCGLLGTEGWLLHRARAAATRELLALERLQQERAWLGQRVPGLSSENEVLLAAEVAAATAAFDGLKRSLLDHQPAASAPDGSTEAFFELADFIKRLRARSAEAQVEIGKDECFGFASHATAGPSPTQIAVVHRQQLAMEYLVDLLVESQPKTLLAVRREKPAGHASGELRSPTGDFFAPDARLSVRHAGEVESDAYQLEFTGQTAALRNFLNRLAAGQRSVVVCSVEVESLAANAVPDARAGEVQVTSSSPLVVPGLSKFSVTVETVRLAGGPAAAAP